MIDSPSVAGWLASGWGGSGVSVPTNRTVRLVNDKALSVRVIRLTDARSAVPSDPPPQPADPEGTDAGPPGDSAATTGEPPPQPEPPLYQQIRNELAYAIIRRVFKPGDRLPSVARLREDFDCAVSTVQRAIAELQVAGFVAPTRAGRYRTVAQKPPRRMPAGWA
jgi:hypothetical protein